MSGDKISTRPKSKGCKVTVRIFFVSLLSELLFAATYDDAIRLIEQRETRFRGSEILSLLAKLFIRDEYLRHAAARTLIRRKYLISVEARNES